MHKYDREVSMMRAADELLDHLCNLAVANPWRLAILISACIVTGCWI